MTILPLGGVRVRGGTAPPSLNLGPPHISETIRAKKLKFYTHLDRAKRTLRKLKFSR